MRITFFLVLNTLFSMTHPMLASATHNDGMLEQSEHKQATQIMPHFLETEDIKIAEIPNESALRALENAKMVSASLRLKKRNREEMADKLSANPAFAETKSEGQDQPIQVQASLHQVQPQTDEVVLATIFSSALQQFIEHSQYFLPKTLLNLGDHIKGHALTIDQLRSVRPYVQEHNLPTFDPGVEKIESRQTVLLDMQKKFSICTHSICTILSQA